MSLIVLCGCQAAATPSAPSMSNERPLRPHTSDPGQDHRVDEPKPLALAAACEIFADQLERVLGERQATVAALPIVEAAGRATDCSTYLADRLASVVLATRLSVVDRQSLKATLKEVDLGAVFADTRSVPSIAAADVLVVGQYVLSAGVLEMNLKVVDVPTNALVLAESYRVRPDSRIRQLIFASSRRESAGTTASLIELERGFRIRASYRQEGAGPLRLLDRVRQRVRGRLISYLRDGLGCDLSPEQIEDIYREGRETDCRFSPGSVELELEFGEPSCLRR